MMNLINMHINTFGLSILILDVADKTWQDWGHVYFSALINSNFTIFIFTF